MGLISDEAAGEIREVFQALVNPVRLAVFSQTLGDPASGDVKRLLDELCAIEPRLSLEPYNYVLDTEKVDAYQIARTPAIAVLGAEKDYGIRFYGLPSGYEFQTLIHAILDVSAADSGLTPETRAALGEIGKDVQIQVFSTPTWPHCPRAVRLAYRFAIESDKVRADGVEVTGYPDLVERYGIRGVPHTVINGDVGFVGAGPETMLLQAVQQATRSGIILA